MRQAAPQDEPRVRHQAHIEGYDERPARDIKLAEAIGNFSASSRCRLPCPPPSGPKENTCTLLLVALDLIRCARRVDAFVSIRMSVLLVRRQVHDPLHP